MRWHGSATSSGAAVSDTAAVLDGLATYFRRFLILSDIQLCALAVWTAHTYIYDIADTTPYLIIQSAEKRSGKTRVIEAMQHVAHKPQAVAALTGPVMFRLIHQERPTLLIDETDTIFRDGRGGPNERQEELRAILNAGYRRGTKIPRMMPTGEIARFEVYAPKLLAGIGHLPETIEDRGLCIRLTRKRKEETVERFRFREVRNGSTEELRQALRAWAPGARLALEGLYPPMPDELDDRAQDAYELLVAIGDAAGDAWGGRTRAALVALRADHDNPNESLGVKLLRDVGLFTDRLEHMGRIPTDDFLALLYAEGESPWEDWWRSESGKKAPRRLALALKEYGVEPVKWREGTATRRGYETGALLSVVARYAPEYATHATFASEQDFSEISTRHTDADCGVLESGDLQGSSVCGESSTENAPPGTLEWAGTASMDELRDFYDTP